MRRCMWYPPDHVAFNNLSPALFTGGSCVRNGTRQASDAGQAQCPRWVIHVISIVRHPLPVYPHNRHIAASQQTDAADNS